MLPLRFEKLFPLHVNSAQCSMYRMLSAMVFTED